MLSKLFICTKLNGARCFSKHLGRSITSQSAYLVSEDTPYTQFFTRCPKLVSINKPQLKIKLDIENMKTVEEGIQLLDNYKQHKYYLNSVVLDAFIIKGISINPAETIKYISSDAFMHVPSLKAKEKMMSILGKTGKGEIIAMFEKYYVDKEKSLNEKHEVKNEEYLAYDHLRTVVPDSSFYSLEYKIDIEKDIWGK